MCSLLLSPNLNLRRTRTPMTSRRTPALLVAVALASGAGGAAVYGLADGGSTTTVQTTAPVTATARPAAAVKTTGALSVNQIYQQTKHGVVDIKVKSSSSSSTPSFGSPGGNGQSQESEAEGSGFVIDTDGHIATNQHVVDGATSIQVTFADGKTASAKVVGTDRSTDVAVIQVDAPKSELHPLTFADSNDVQVGDGVVAIGSPFGLKGTVTTGIISALDRTIEAPNNFTISGAIQTDAAINHGNSGGPLLDSGGHVIGINSQIESDSGGNDGIGFAVPSSMVQRVAQQLISGGKVAHAYLGVQLGDATSGAGAQVGQVASGGPAADAGLRSGDVVTAIDGKAIAGSEALVNAVDSHKPGDQVTLTVRRGGDTSSIKVKLGTRPN
jgi:putative serine protease PepD